MEVASAHRDAIGTMQVVVRIALANTTKRRFTIDPMDDSIRFQSAGVGTGDNHHSKTAPVDIE